jgi:hypothetical protein
MIDAAGGPLGRDDNGRRIPVDLVLLPDHCYRCGAGIAPVVGIRLDDTAIPDGFEYGMLADAGGWFLPYDERNAVVIAAACPDALLEAHGVGPLRWRATHVCPDGYLANTCARCQTVLGNWPLHEALIEHQAEGGELNDLPRIASELMEEALTLLSLR